MPNLWPGSSPNRHFTILELLNLLMFLIWEMFGGIFCVTFAVHLRTWLLGEGFLVQPNAILAPVGRGWITAGPVSFMLIFDTVASHVESALDVGFTPARPATVHFFNEERDS